MFRRLINNYRNSDKIWKYYVPFMPYPKQRLDYVMIKNDWIEKLKDIKLSDDDKNLVADTLIKIKDDEKLYPMNDRHFMNGKIIKCAVMFFSWMYLAFPDASQQADLIIVLPEGILAAAFYIARADMKRYNYLNIDEIIHQYLNKQTKKDICRNITRRNTN